MTTEQTNTSPDYWEEYTRTVKAETDSLNKEIIELIDEINELNATIRHLRTVPDKINQEWRELYKEATKKRHEAEEKIEDLARDSALDANYAYWEGQCHALAALKRAMG